VFFGLRGAALVDQLYRAHHGDPLVIFPLVDELRIKPARTIEWRY
jgi:hypothetical protein